MAFRKLKPKTKIIECHEDHVKDALEAYLMMLKLIKPNETVTKVITPSGDNPGHIAFVELRKEV